MKYVSGVTRAGELQFAHGCKGDRIGSSGVNESNITEISSYTIVGVTSNPSYSGLVAKLSGVALGTVASKKLGNFYIKY